MLRHTRTRTLYRLPDGRAAAAASREIAARELTDAGAAGEVEDTGLLLSELVAERLEQQPDPDASLTVDVLRAPRHRHRWAVVDRARPTLPAGLRSVALDAIADSWGVSRVRGLTRTWFELRARRGKSKP